MGQQTTITLQPDAKSRLEDTKPDDVSWTEWVYAITEDGELSEYSGEPQSAVENAEQLQEIASAVRTIEERTGSIEQMLEGLQR